VDREEQGMTESADVTLTGGCACGDLRYEVAGAPIYVNNCHCTLCQRQTGSTSVVNAFFEAEALTLLRGQTSRHLVQSGSGGDHAIMRCAQCGTAVWSVYPRLGELGFGLRVGTLDDPNALRPDAAIFTANKMDWVSLPAGIPAFETTYDPAKLLPPERYARLKALIERRAAQKAAQA
jgi:hypothetical protein